MIAVIVLNVVPFLGQLAAVVFGFAVTPGIYAIIDNKRGAVDALKWSVETVRAHPVPWLLAYLVGNIVSCAGLIALFIGVILTAPLGALINIIQYERVRPSV
jgi:uncharacterized membrane protein